MNSEISTPQKVGIFGGTGYVGSYLVDRLLDQDKHPVLLVRPGSESKVRQADRCTLITGDMNDQQAIDSVAEASDALIFNIGILREFPDKGITFEELH